MKIQLDLSWKTVQDYLLILIGTFIQALTMRLFLIPAQLVSGGISGAAQIINHYATWPIGLMTLVGNLPLFVLGWRTLGGLHFAVRTGFAIAFFSIFTDLLALFTPAQGITGDLVLNTIYGALLYGIGLGFVYRARGTSGGNDILCRILNIRFNVPLSQSYIYVDALIVLLGGIAFGWEKALYGLIVIYACGISAEMISEGSSVFRTALIVTTRAEEVADRIMKTLERGVTILSGTGAYTGASRPVLYCVVTRAEVNQLKELVKESDPAAFMVIGQAHEALGEGFKSLTP